MAAYMPLAPQVSLDSPVDQAPNSNICWSEIVNSLWSNQFTAGDIRAQRSQLSFLFNYYADQGSYAGMDSGGHLVAGTHRTTTEIVAQVLAGNARALITQTLEQRLPAPRPANADEQIANSIDLATRLLSMVQVGDPSHYALTRCDRLLWEQGSIQSFMDNLFQPQVALATDRTKLENLFNARNLERISGLEIRWTVNLADHLRLMDAEDGEPDAVVRLFHGASIFGTGNRSLHQIYPAGFVDETLKTISLLFPRNNDDVVNWYRKLAPAKALDLSAITLPLLKTRDRRIENFSFWRDRLVILKQRFDEAEPGSLGQWRHDRRKKVQFYTFWIAMVGLVVTAFFSVVQSVEGAIQVYKAYHPAPSPSG